MELFTADVLQQFDGCEETSSIIIIGFNLPEI